MYCELQPRNIQAQHQPLAQAVQNEVNPAVMPLARAA